MSGWLSMTRVIQRKPSFSTSFCTVRPWVRAAMGDREGAVEILSTILADQAGSQQLALQPAPIHAIAEEMLAELQPQIGPEPYAAAVERGRSRATEVIVKELLLGD